MPLFFHLHTLDQALHFDPYREFFFDHHEALQILQSLQQNVTSLKSFLKVFPQKETLKLEGRIRDAAQEAEDIVEHFISSELHLKYSSEKGNYNLEQLCLHLPEVSQKIDQILKEVEEIKITSRKGTQPKHAGSSSTAVSSSWIRSSQSHNDTFVGREDDLLEIKTRICGESLKLEIIPIVGMGGSGKTTLARQLYSDKLVVEKFDFHSWATISQEYRVQDILLQLLDGRETIDGDDAHKLLIERLYKTLKGRRYLIILDDIWEGEAWNAVRRAFPNDNNGSRIILTTRVAQVAANVDSSAHLHGIKLLTDDQSWDLLEKKVFGQDPCPLELEKTGREISKNCKGLPLAIVVIAGVLSSERTLHHWKYVAENLMATLNESTGDGGIFELLSLSYTHLPHYLRPCFLHLGAVFPEDYEIDAPRLILLWVAEGFIESNDECKSLEEMAQEYLGDLVKRNLVLKIPNSYTEEVVTCRIHDVLREWCIKKAHDEGSFIHVSPESEFLGKLAPTTNQRQRRLAIHSKSWDWSKIENIRLEQIRTINAYHDDPLVLFHAIRLRQLRVLDARMYGQHHVPITRIFELYQLRYLAFIIGWGLEKFEVPGSISKLLNLQTLILKAQSASYVALPVEIWGMPQLRHLISGSPYFIMVAPSARTIEEKGYLLQNLQTLSKVMNLILSTEIVNMMPNLKELMLSYKGMEVSIIQEATYQLKHLNGLAHLEHLTFEFPKSNFTHSHIDWNTTRLLESLASFPATLTSLTLEGCRFPWESMKSIGSLPNLHDLTLCKNAFEGDEWETSDDRDQFPSLTRLEMRELDLHQWIVAESNHFLRLEQLRLFICQKLEEIPECIGQVPTLQLIDVKWCSICVEASARKILDEQRDYGNDLLQVYIDDERQ